MRTNTTGTRTAAEATVPKAFPLDLALLASSEASK